MRHFVLKLENPLVTPVLSYLNYSYLICLSQITALFINWQYAKFTVGVESFKGQLLRVVYFKHLLMTL